MMRRSAALYGIIGLILLTFGIIDHLIAPGFRFFVWVNLVAGIFALVLWITSSGAAIGTLVGQRSTRYGANAIIYSVAFIALIVGANYLSSLFFFNDTATTE